MMKRAMAECSGFSKPGRWLSLCYHDTSEGTWALVQDIMAEVGFVVDKTDRPSSSTPARSRTTSSPPTRPRSGTWS